MQIRNPGFGGVLFLSALTSKSKDYRNTLVLEKLRQVHYLSGSYPLNLPSLLQHAQVNFSLTARNRLIFTRVRTVPGCMVCTSAERER